MWNWYSTRQAEKWGKVVPRESAIHNVVRRLTTKLVMEFTGGRDLFDEDADAAEY